MSFLPGYVAAVQISSTPYTFSKFSFAEDAALGDVTNFTGNGAPQFIPGLLGAKIKLSGPYDSGAMTGFAPNSLVALTLVFNTTGPISLDVPCIVKSCTINVDTKEAQMVDIECWSTGEFDIGPI